MEFNYGLPTRLTLRHAAVNVNLNRQWNHFHDVYVFEQKVSDITYDVKLQNRQRINYRTCLGIDV